MLQDDILNLSLGHLSTIGFSGKDKPHQFQYGNTIKDVICDISSYRDISLYGHSRIQITVPAGDYTQAIFNDLHFGHVRIKEQCKNLTCPLEANAQPAWVLITAYYAAYFMVNEISKINGKHVVNLNRKELETVLSAQSPSTQNSIEIEDNNSFFVTVGHAQAFGEIILSLKKSFPRPHQIAWANFGQLVNKLKINDERVAYHLLLRSLVSDSGSGWETPSAVRNTWNYSQSNYFGPKGDEIGKTFSSIIKSPKSTFGWARNNNLKPTIENMAASIAYVYHTLNLSYQAIISRLRIDD
jgi:hypothetical protein